jgi:hemerythrin
VGACLQGVGAREKITAQGNQMSLVWRPAMSTGLDWQDEQHKEIFRQIDLLNEAIEQNEGASVVKEMLEFLESYATKHFRDEEEYMHSHGCQTCDLHEKCHQMMLANIAEIRATFDRHGPSTMVVLKLQTLFRDWLLNHILTVDKKMVTTSNREAYAVDGAQSK